MFSAEGASGLFPASKEMTVLEKARLWMKRVLKGSVACPLLGPLSLPSCIQAPIEVLPESKGFGNLGGFGAGFKSPVLT